MSFTFGNERLENMSLEDKKKKKLNVHIKCWADSTFLIQFLMTGDCVMETFCQEGAVSKLSFLRISSLMFCFVICLKRARS